MSATLMPIRISAVLAITPSGGMGKSGTLPWAAAGIHLPGDLKYFKKMTSATKNPSKCNAVIMGRRTWDGIPEKNRPLPGRINIVLTRNPQWASTNLPSDVLSSSSLDSCLELIKNDVDLSNKIEKAVIIGGSQLFEEAALHPLCNEFHLTRIEQEFDSDTHMSSKTKELLERLTPENTSERLEENGVGYRMFVYDPSKETTTTL